MLFNSYQYIFIFFPLTFFIYFYLNKKKLTEIANFFLVVSSLFYYSWFNRTYFLLISFSITFNYFTVKLLYKYKNKSKTILFTGILTNIIILCYFKYYNFLIENINFLLKNEIIVINSQLPLAISFFTFQQIAYLVDSYRGETQNHKFINYSLFVSFFPKLISGPIVNHKEIMGQFENIKNKTLNYENILSGIILFSIGFFKKVVIADTFSIWATSGFDTPKSLNFFEAWATSLSYTFQLYFDFSGYTDMAIGSALFFNIVLPINFNSPYKSSNIQEFWRRWHITLSSFLRDYIYIPLGGNKNGNIKTYTNLMTTFLIGGLWHGAGWPFIFWGFLHGVALCVHRYWKQTKIKINPIIGWIITFNFINIAWIFFRANNFSDAIRIINAMFSFKQIEFSTEFAIFFNYINPMKDIFTISGHKIISNITVYTYEMILFSFLIVILTKNSNDKILNKYLNFKNTIYASLLFFYSMIFSFFGSSIKSEFLYFNF